MKRNNTYVLFDSAATAHRHGWVQAHDAIARALQSMRWPDCEGVKEFTIPRIVTIQVGQEYTNFKGKLVKVKKRAVTLRNGVRPLRDQFRHRMVEQRCTCEAPLSLAPFFQKLRGNDAVVFSKYPAPIETELEKAKNEALNESVGDLDFWFQTDGGFATAVEWETGNISSSHRSLNKLCLALMGGLIDAGVLVVPSLRLYPHLTDRIGNIRELQPYFYFWNRFGTLVERGLLAVIEVEHDELQKSFDQREFVPTGTDGNSPRKAAPKRKPTRLRSAKKR